MQTASNSQFKSKLLKLILTLLITLTAVQFTSTVTAHAEDNSKSYNGTDAGSGVSVGSLYWGGSTERSGIIMYIYDTANKEIMRTGNGIHDAEICIRIMQNDTEFKRVTETDYRTHFGSVSITNDHADKLAPTPVIWEDATSKWYGNNTNVKEYFFTEYTIGERTVTQWELLVLNNFGAKALVELKGNQNLILVVEPIACQAVYSTQTWGSDEAAQEYIDNQIAMFGDNHSDNDYVKWLQKYKEQNGTMATAPKPAIINGSIKRVSATGRNAAYQAQSIVHSCFGIEERDKCSEGGANWKWTNQALPYCMVLEHDFDDISAITDSYPTRKSSDEFYDKNRGYALSIFDAEIKASNIHTYDIDNNPIEPAPSEQPSKDKDTTGDVTIVKLFYHATVDGLTGDVTWENTTKTTSGTTGYIVAQDESDKTGYRLQIWGTVSDEKSFSGYKYEDAYSRILKWKNHGESAGNIRISNAGTGDTESHKYVYLLYSKVTYLPAPQVQSYDFEIPESYITKQVYFSQANNTSNTQSTAQKLIQNTFKWTSQAHPLCPGHNVWSCTKDEHEHATDTMYAQGTVKCTKQEHSHSDGCLKKRYECKKCDAQEWYDWNAVTHTTSCPLTTTEKADAANYSISRQVRDGGGSLKCVECGQNSSDKHWVSSITHADNCKYKSYKTGKIPDDAYKCENSYTHTAWSSKDAPGCYNTVYTTVYTCNDNKTSCNTEEHEHGITKCTTVKYCGTSLSDSSLKLSIKNTKQSDYPNILATNPNASTTIKSDKAITAALQGSSISAAKLSKWFETTRDITAEDSKQSAFDYTTILLRGSDEITLPEWLKDYVLVENGVKVLDQPAAMEYLTGTNSVSNIKFKVGNTPQGNKKYATYQEVFSAAFKDDSEDKETVLSFNYPSGVSSATLEWVSSIVPIKTFEKCPSNSKAYSLSIDTVYEIPTITVKVNVLSQEITQGANGSQSTGNTTVTFYPYFRMFYDTEEDKAKTALILGETPRTLQAKDAATITYSSNNQGTLTLNSAQWSTHKSAKDTLNKLTGNSADTSKILPGGAALDLSITQSNTQTVNTITYQIMSDFNTPHRCLFFAHF